MIVQETREAEHLSVYPKAVWISLRLLLPFSIALKISLLIIIFAGLLLARAPGPLEQAYVCWVLGIEDWSGWGLLSSYHPAGISWSIKETAGNSGSTPEGREQLKGRNSFYTQLPKPTSTYSLSSFFKGKEWWVRDRDVLCLHQEKPRADVFIDCGILIWAGSLVLGMGGMRNSQVLAWVCKHEWDWQPCVRYRRNLPRSVFLLAFYATL